MTFRINFTHTKNRGITLTELIVSSVMIGVVMVGVASFGLAIKNLQRSTNKTVLVAMRTKAAMARITQDALASTGFAGDRGVIAWTNNTDSSSICFRYDTSDTAEFFNDDEWVCYFHGAPYELHRCVQPSTYSPGGGCNTFASCCGGTPISVETAIQLSDPSPNPFIRFAEISGNLEFIIITLTVRYIFDDPLHPIDNPEYTLSTRVDPLAHSR